MSDPRDTLPSSRLRVRRTLIGMALLVSVGLIALWLARKPIADGLIRRTLVERGVPARYTVADVGLGRQRWTNIVIGDPAHPDLVADWVETVTRIGLAGPRLEGVRVGHVRLGGRMVGGRLSFGALDRLLPASSGKPFTLPAIDARIGDARLRLETPIGRVAVKIAGAGRLDGGFGGSLTATSGSLHAGNCITSPTTAVFAIRVTDARPVLAGPVRLSSLTCGGATLANARADVTATLASTFDSWRGSARLAVAHVRSAQLTAAQVGGAIGFAGDARRDSGTVDLHSLGFAAGGVSGSGLSLAGRYDVSGSIFHYQGSVGARGVALGPDRLQPLARMIGQAAGTPVGPVVDQIAAAAVAAGRDFDARAEVAVRYAEVAPSIALSRLVLASRSGAQVNSAGSGLNFEQRRWHLANLSGSFAGGGLPRGTVSIAQAGSGLEGEVLVQPYAAGQAELTLAPVRITVAQGAGHVTTRASLSGPMGSGRIEHLALPIDLRWNGALLANAACTPIGFTRLAVSGLTLAPTHGVLCPVYSALLRYDHAGLAFGARVGPTAFQGTLGTAPVALALQSGSIDTAGFALDGVKTSIGVAERATRIDVARLTGRYRGGSIDGRFSGAGGQIGIVPLRLAAGAGNWHYADGRLTLAGALGISDTDPVARFKPLQARGVAFALAGNRITATAALYEPSRSGKVADLAIEHTLADGHGRADLKVANLSFDDHFQPERLTPLTLGVIADVRGSIDGAAHIGWTADGVTSTGDFHTGAIDLDAAVGPVAGIAGTIHFTDLLALQSATGQVVTVKSINPGIPVNDGTIRYQTLPGARIAVERADWPFAGGLLRLDPTVLDFSAPAERRMTFHVEHIAADQFLQQFNFKNLDATGIFDGVLPMVFDTSGGRIERGSLTVRAGGGTIAYVGEIGQKDLGTWANIAFQALKSLRYRSLAIAMNGPLAGEMITDVTFAGISQGQGAKSNFVVRRLQRLPFVFNIRIKAPFRGLLDSAQSFYDPARLVQRNLPALIEQQDRAATVPPTPIQPPASRNVP